jgi:polar amino acid transport system substrate-binding protein
MQWVLLITMGLLSFALQAKPLNIATGDYPPFTDASKPNQGSLVAYTEEVFKQLGYQAKHQFIPWKRCLSEPLESKHLMLTGYWFDQPHLHQDYLFSTPLVAENAYLFSLDKPAQQINQLNDLAYQRIGLVNGYSYGALLQNLAKHQIEPDYANTPYQNLHKLLTGRIQAMVMTEAVAQQVLQKFKPQQQAQIRRAEHPIIYNHLHLLFPKHHPQSEALLERFNQAVKQNPFSAYIDPNDTISQKNHK